MNGTGLESRQGQEDRYPLYMKLGGAPRPAGPGAGKLPPPPPTGIQSLDHPACSESSCLLRYSGPLYSKHYRTIQFFKRFLCCSEVYKNVYMNLQFKTVPYTSLHETSDLI
jgi:hypothetical protein